MPDPRPGQTLPITGPYSVLNSGSYNSGGNIESGSSFLVGDGYYITAAHIAYEFNQAANPALRSVGHDSNVVFSLDHYEDYYLQAAMLYGSSSLVDSDVIEGSGGPAHEFQLDIIGRDAALVTGTGTVGASDTGMALFLDPNDLLTLGSSFGSSLARYWNAPSIGAGSTSGSVTGLTGYGAGFTFSAPSVGGQSGGPYTFEFDSHYYSFGVQSATSPTQAYGVYFTPDFFNNVNFLMGTTQTGNVTATDPQNLIYGPANGDTIVGTYRADVLMGRGGNDTISDGDDRLDTVWADDTLIGGADNDQFTAGAGNDTIWGGDKGNETGRADGVDTVSYANAFSDVTVTVSGTTTPSVTVLDGSGQGSTDTLHSIEQIVGSENNDRLVLQSLTPDIANAFDWIDLGAGTDAIDISGLSGAVTVDLRNLSDQTVTLGSATLHLRTSKMFSGQALTTPFMLRLALLVSFSFKMEATRSSWRAAALLPMAAGAMIS